MKCFLGGCTITSKGIINDLKKNSSLQVSFRDPPNFQKTLILAFEANSAHCPAKMDFFPRFSSLCQYYCCCQSLHYVSCPVFRIIAIYTWYLNSFLGEKCLATSVVWGNLGTKNIYGYYLLYRQQFQSI